MKLADLDIAKIYAYADYLTWHFEERVELIRGKIFKIGPESNLAHQLMAGELFRRLANFLEKQECRAFVAPFDVRLPRRSSSDQEVITVLQPDVCVVCDRSKCDARGCAGAPDLVIEVLSPGNNAKELRNKFEVYEEAGVREYWIVFPQDYYVLVNRLVDGKYVTSRPLVQEDMLTTEVLPGFSLSLKDLFESARP
ncbi:MAG: Uma2 family endonuclease [Bacteroidota bacterium]